MNKKAIAIDVAKHPIIKKLLEMNIASSSIINRLIVEEILNEDPEDIEPWEEISEDETEDDGIATQRWPADKANEEKKWLMMNCLIIFRNL